MDRLDDVQRQEFLTSHPGWQLEGEQISKVFEFADFVGSMRFLTAVAILAERADHHPDIDIRWNKVLLRLSTHSAQALTSKDTELAAQIESAA